MFCKECEKFVPDNKAECPYCGSTELEQKEIEVTHDAPSKLWWLICFLVPCLGLVMYFVWRKKFSQRADSCLYAFLTQVGIALFIGIFYGIIGMVTCAFQTGIFH